jgi:hypothetical protein
VGALASSPHIVRSQREEHEVAVKAFHCRALQYGAQESHEFSEDGKKDIAKKIMVLITTGQNHLRMRTGVSIKVPAECRCDESVH